MQLFEVARCRVGGEVGVASLVDKRVYLKAEPCCCRRHKLPKTACSGAGNGGRYQRRFYDRQIFELERHLVAFECFLEDGHVVEAEAKQVLHQLRAVRIMPDGAFHNIVERHLYHSREL